MYLGIDVGGTKTLLAVFSAEGQIVDEQRLPTAKSYPTFIKQLDKLIKTELADHRIAAACCALPGRIDRKKGIGIFFANIPAWKDVPIKNDLEKLLPGTQIFIEHDAQLGALSEAQFLKDKYKRVLYLTLSTGVGGRMIIDGQIDPNLTIESGQMVLEYHGQLKRWETFASGKALKETYGQLASQIEDPEIWQEYTYGVALGLNEMIDTLSPDVVVVGGGVGAHFEKFKDLLQAELLKLSSPLVPIPPLLKAQRPEEAVIYGCYDYIHQKLEGKV